MKHVFYLSNDKQLLCSKPIRHYQGETSVNGLQFLIPTTYEVDGELVDLADFKCLMYYKLQTNIVRAIVIEPENDLYKGKYSYLCPIKSEMTDNAGTITFWLSFMNSNLSTGNVEILHTDEASFTILPLNDYFKMDNQSLMTLDKALSDLEVQKQALTTMTSQLQQAHTAITQTIPNDLVLVDGDKLHLSANGQSIGTGVQIITSVAEDNMDNTNDGILDLDDLRPEYADQLNPTSSDNGYSQGITEL